MLGTGLIQQRDIFAQHALMQSWRNPLYTRFWTLHFQIGFFVFIPLCCQKMCTPDVQYVFRRMHTGLCLTFCALGILLIATRPPLHVEFYMVTPKPVNGSLQVIVCNAQVKVMLADGTIVQHCEYQVDNIHRIQVNAYHVGMGFPCLLVCVVGCLFSVMTSKEAAAHAGLMTADLLFIVQTYAGETSQGRRNTLYRWECVFWGYVFLVHVFAVMMLASPVDVFDCIVIVSFQQLCIMYLCRPRQANSDDTECRDGGGGIGMYSLVHAEQNNSSHAGGANGTWMQAILGILLLFIAWNNFMSIPHVYEADRVWAFAILVGMDLLLLVVHLYDYVPTMYTIIMGRFLYVVVMSATILGMLYAYKHRLLLYANVDKMV